ncbi:MAG: CarD family transcriptional regulator, partial [Aestuariivirgaceae bacterium]
MDFGPLFKKSGRALLTRVPPGMNAMVLADLTRRAAPRRHLHIVRDDQRLASLAEALAFFAPDVKLLRFPAWDCLPYDRVPPVAEIVAQRLTTLGELTTGQEPSAPMMIATTVNAVMQRVPPRSILTHAQLMMKPGNLTPTAHILSFLSANGFNRTGTVVDSGDFAVRGGIIDLFPPGADEPIRLDFFGDTLESIRTFDPQSQRTTGQLHALNLRPASEVLLNDQTVARFRTRYAAQFGGVDLDDPLYEAITAGRRYQGMEHWLPLFYDRLETLFDYIGDSVVSLDYLADEAVPSRLDQIGEYFRARQEALESGSYGSVPYKPLPPDKLYLDAGEWREHLDRHPVVGLTPFDIPGSDEQLTETVDGMPGRNFAPERSAPGTNVYEAVKAHIDDLRNAGKRVAIAAWTEGAAERLQTILSDHGLGPLAAAGAWADVMARSRDVVSTIVLGLDSGFETPDFAVIAEQDILGDRLIRRVKKAKRASDFISELASVSPGDLVVHIDHGIGRFEGLRTIEVQGAPHDCLFLQYAGGDRLFLPVENIELLSRYGSDETGVELDRLGG